MADETLEGQTQEQNTEAPVTAENPGEDQSTASPAGQQDYASKLAALEARLEREQERTQQLEASVRLQERYQQQQQQRASRQPVEDDEDVLSDELKVLDKALTPLLDKRFRTKFDPLTERYSAMADDNDSVRFDMFLMRNHPELMEDPDQYERVIGTVNQIRDAAKQRGFPSLSRVDAFVFSEGLNGTRQKMTQRKAKRATAQNAESQRQAEVNTASRTSQSSPRQTENVGINAIREKANRGEKLTPDEKSKFRNYVENIEF